MYFNWQWQLPYIIHNPDLRLERKMKTRIIKAIFPLDLALFITLCSCFLLDLSSFPILAHLNEKKYRRGSYGTSFHL